MTKESDQIERFRNVTTETGVALFKIIFSSLGPLGTAFDEVIFGIGERIRGKRLEQFVDILSDRLKTIESQIQNKSLTHSEDFYDLSISILSSAMKTRLEIKHKILSNILIESIKHKLDWEHGNSQTYVKYVDELTEKHIFIFDYLVKKQKEFTDLKSYENLFSIFSKDNDYFEIEKYEFRMYLRDLENKTLLHFNKDINEFGSTGGLFATEDYKQIPGISVTPIGIDFYNYIK